MPGLTSNGYKVGDGEDRCVRSIKFQGFGQEWKEGIKTLDGMELESNALIIHCYNQPFIIMWVTEKLCRQLLKENLASHGVVQKLRKHELDMQETY